MIPVTTIYHSLWSDEGSLKVRISSEILILTLYSSMVTGSGTSGILNQLVFCCAFNVLFQSLHCKIFATVSSSPRLADERLY